MPKMKTTIEALAEAGLGNQVSVLVGGAPVTAAYAEQIGAHAYAGDAVGAVDTARQLVGAE
jgi:5-methyltetrahydrofolate--homocysteine methyltransferase